MPRKPELTDRQKLFVAEYPRDLNMTRAAERAGYKHPKQLGTKLMSLPHVKDAIIAGMERRVEKLGIDAEWVLRKAVEIYERVAQEIKPALHPKYRTQMRDDDGNLLFTFDASAALRALELVGKHVDVGAFEDKLKVGIDQELIDILHAGRRRANLDNADDRPAIDITPEPAPTKVLRKPSPAKVERPLKQDSRGNPNFRSTPQPIPSTAPAQVRHEYDPYKE